MGRRDKTSFKEQVRGLETLLARQQSRWRTAAAEVEQARHREQALTDICRCLEDIMYIRQRYSSLVAPQACPPPTRTNHNQQHEQQAQASSSSHLTSGMAAAHPDAGAAGSGAAGQQLAAGNLLAVLDVVPDYCCFGHLLRSAGPELARAATSLTAAQWQQLATQVVYELLLLMELEERQQQQQQQQEQQQASAETGPTGGSDGGADDDGSTPMSSSSGSPRSDAHEPPAAAAAAAAAAAGPATAAWPANPSCTQAAACRHTATVRPACVHAAGPSAQLRRLNRRIWGLFAVAVALDNRPVVQAQATALSRLEQQQQQAGAQEGVLRHWQQVVRRLNLTPQQAGYIAACGDEANRFIGLQHDQLQRLVPLSSTPGLQVLAAIHEQQQHQQQQDSRGGGSSSGGGGSAAHSMLTGTVAATAIAAAAADPGEGEDGGSSMAAVSRSLSKFALVGCVSLLTEVECLTTTQLAQLLVASYPGLPSPACIALCAGQLLREQQLPANQAQQGHLAAPSPRPQQVQPPQQPGEVQQQRQHLQQHRRRWWAELLEVLPPEEAAQVCAAHAAAVARGARF